MKSELVGLLRGSAVAHEELARPQGVGHGLARVRVRVRVRVEVGKSEEVADLWLGSELGLELGLG